MVDFLKTMGAHNIIFAVAETPGATTGKLFAGKNAVPCAFGRSGLMKSKQEGDGATPIGSWRLRKLYYRSDRLASPMSKLAKAKIKHGDGWCDDPSRPEYNQPVKLPFGGSHEQLWRCDHLYDLMIPLGYNDDPVIPGKGSAIFFHLTRPDYRPTQGCVAIAPNDMLDLLPYLSDQTVMKICLEGDRLHPGV